MPNNKRAMFTFYVREILSMPMLAEKSKYFEYFLNWYHLMKAKASASRISTMKTPPKKARANEELELVAVHGDGFGVIVVVGGVVVGLDGALVVVAGLVVVCGGVDGSSLGELELVALEEVGSAAGAIELELVVLEAWVVLSTGASLVELEAIVLEMISEELAVVAVEFVVSFVFGATGSVVFTFVASNVAATLAVVVVKVSPAADAEAKKKKARNTC